MIKYLRETLDNGLTVLCHTDRGTPFVSVNVLYKVGSRNETADKTGFAHLFEHLMFSGSKHVPDFDKEVQRAGGDSNAYTTNDYTNYYITIPASHIETALWLESDRMLALNITQQSLDVQKQVVIEEFKQRFLNTPYGDVWLKLRPLAYLTHPYRWSTIGVSPEHIERATLSDVQNFFNKYYSPDNAIISIAGNIEETHALELVKKWFEDIPSYLKMREPISKEPSQMEARILTSSDNEVPSDAFWKAYHMSERMSHQFYTCDIISDILSNGQSSRLYLNLVKEQGIFSDVDASITGDKDPGLFVFSGKLSEGISMEKAEKAIDNEISKIISEPVQEIELQKVINKMEARFCYGEIGYQNKASNLAYYEFLGNVALVNSENKCYYDITPSSICETARQIFRPENCSTLYYLKK